MLPQKYGIMNKEHYSKISHVCTPLLVNHSNLYNGIKELYVSFDNCSPFGEFLNITL